MGVKEKKSLLAYLKKSNGQAAIEMGLSLPFFIFLLYYTINAFHAQHTAHVGQKYAAMDLYLRLNNRAQFVVDDVEDREVSKQFMAVQYTAPDGQLPTRRILLDNKVPVRILNVVGICREPECN